MPTPKPNRPTVDGVFGYLVRGKQRWGVRYRDHRGKWMRKLGFARKAEARHWKTEHDESRSLWAHSRESFDRAAAQYLAEQLGRGRQERSYLYLPLWAEHFGARVLSSVTPDEIETRLDAWQAERGWSPATRNRALAQISGLYTWAQGRRMVPQHPIRGWIGHQPEGKGRQRWLTLAEVEEVAGHSPEWLADIVRFAVATGMRRSEICGLTKASLVEVDEKLAYLVTLNTKNGQTLHWPLEGRILGELRRRAAGLPFPGSYLFPGPGKLRSSKDGRRYPGGNADASIRRYLPDAVRAAGLTWSGTDPHGVTFHSFRHSMASLALSRGISTEGLMALGNWRSRRMVDRYAHMADEALKGAASTMSELVYGQARDRKVTRKVANLPGEEDSDESPE